jgi:hypothetical protein
MKMCECSEIPDLVTPKQILIVCIALTVIMLGVFFIFGTPERRMCRSAYPDDAAAAGRCEVDLYRAQREVGHERSE